MQMCSVIIKGLDSVADKNSTSSMFLFVQVSIQQVITTVKLYNKSKSQEASKTRARNPDELWFYGRCHHVLFVAPVAIFFWMGVVFFVSV